jgi:hypothetical protein
MTDAATMRKISFWRYSAVNRKTLFAALACASLVFSMLGCGTTNHLQTITLTASGSSGLFNVAGEGGTLQLVATGNYSSQKTHDLTNVVAYSISVTPGSQDAFGFALADPPQTLTLNDTGLLTAVPPFDCTWVDVSPDPKKFAWFLSGSYAVTASFQGITSQPVYISVASSAGNPDNPPLIGNNPTEQCGP